MEIERKWIVDRWPDGLSEDREYFMRQGYLTVHPTVRIREEALSGGETAYILCLKSGSGLARSETEIRITPEEFREIEEMIGLPLIPKLRKNYLLSDGHVLEVNLVDEGTPTEYMYAEIEFDSVEEARSFDPASAGLQEYLSHEVTEEPQQTMGAYWLMTRKKGADT